MRIGTLLMWVGAGVLVIGALLRYSPGLLSWFGNLPGDIRIEGENTRVLIPITSMIVVSVATTVLVSLIGVIFRER